MCEVIRFKDSFFKLKIVPMFGNGFGYDVGGRFAADSARHKTRSVCGKLALASVRIS